MKFWLLFAVLSCVACAHNPRLEAFDRALELLVASAVLHVDTGVDDASPLLDSGLTPEDLELVHDVLGEGAFCDNESRAEVEWHFQAAQDECRSAWLAFGDDQSFDPALESMNMLGSKVGYEALIADCGGSTYERAVADNVYRFVWKPGNPDGDTAIWTKAWDGCFGTPSERIARGAVLEGY